MGAELGGHRFAYPAETTDDVVTLESLHLSLHRPSPIGPAKLATHNELEHGSKPVQDGAHTTQDEQNRKDVTRR